jgi:glycosyltransferase involved in cell wall biosynthesis
VRALLIAEAANPEWTSVPLEGWSHTQAIARRCDSHLVTQVRNREAITRAGLIEGKDFTAIDSELVAGPLNRFVALMRGGAGKGWTTAMAMKLPGYLYFEHVLWTVMGARILAGEFDIVHRITPLSPTYPSPIARRCAQAKVPFVIGPLNGGVPWPKQFDVARRKEREWLSYVRCAYKLLPGYRGTRKHASAILIGSRDTWNQMPERYRDKCFYVPENAITPARFETCRARPATKPIKVVFAGRLVPYKGADMLIEAAAPLVRSGAATVDIIGNGPEMEALRGLIERLNVQDGVRLLGWVAHEKLHENLAAADVFGFPSIREFGGGVVLEAMACGLVPVVIDYGGPAELVTDRTGFRIAMGDRRQIIERFTQVLMNLASEPGQIDTLSPNAMRRAREQFTWDEKAKRVVEIYRWVLNRNLPKPQFDMPTPDLSELVIPYTNDHVRQAITEH